MQSFNNFSGNTDNSKPSKPIIIGGSLVVIVAILICVAMKLKASTPHNPSPNPALIQLTSTSQTPVQPQMPTPPTQTLPTQSTPTDPVPTADTTPVTPTDQTPGQSTDTTPDQSSGTTSDQSSDQTTDPSPDPTPDQPSGPQLASMTITPGSVYVGSQIEIDVTLDAAAPPGGASVSLSMGDADQDPIDIPEGFTSGSVSYNAPDSSGTDTFTCTYGGVTYNDDLTVMDLKDCADTYDDDDDTPCIGVDGDTTTRGEWKYRQEQQQYYAQREQEQLHEETGNGD